MAQYMLLIYDDPTTWGGMSEDERNAIMGEYFAYSEEIDKAGIVVASEALHPIETAKSVRLRDGERLLTDGPFAETREQLGGFYLLECANLDEAIGWAAKIPGASTGCVEVRPVMDYEAMGAEAPDHDAAARP